MEKNFEVAFVIRLQDSKKTFKAGIMSVCVCVCVCVWWIKTLSDSKREERPNKDAHVL